MQGTYRGRVYGGVNLLIYLDPLKVLFLEIFCSVWGEEVQGQDCGDEAANWICEFLNKPDFRHVSIA